MLAPQAQPTTLFLQHHQLPPHRHARPAEETANRRIAGAAARDYQAGDFYCASAALGAFGALSAQRLWRRCKRRGGIEARRLVIRAAQSSDTSEDLPEVARRVALGSAATFLAVAGGDAYLRSADETYAVAGNILAPAPYKETLRTELVPGKIWGFEQCLALTTVSANVRMTVVRLQDGKLWVAAPIAPTRQCFRLLDELGEVAHIVAPSTALEHRVSLGEFAKQYPKASVWVTPGQGPLFPPPAGCKILPGAGQAGSGVTPSWANELELKLFFVEPPVTDVFAEAAFFHKPTQTLLVTDCALKINDVAPKVLESYGFDGTPGPISLEQWKYKAVAFNFVTARDMDDKDFAALQSPAAIVNPLLRFLVYRRCPDVAAAWVSDVARWPFKRIVPAHLAAPYDCTPEQFLSAFGFLFGKKSSWEPEDEQLTLLRFLREQLGGPEF
mmetsp:Transcript_11097/g.25440  ORF Transcript_11097/g.25440 Transcript_11097/m.25440 type:complete len:443 (-) Transcript_11097:21-1349(-)